MKRLFLVLGFFATTASAQVREIEITPTVDLAAYTSGDTIGGLQTVSNVSCSGEMFEVLGAKFSDKKLQSITRDVTLFKSLPSGTFTDQAATDPSDADLLLAAGPIQVASGNCFTYNDNAICSIGSLNSPGRSAALFNSRRRFYVAITTRGADDFDSTSDLTLTLFIRCL